MSSVMPPLEDDVFGVTGSAEDQQVAKLRLPQYSMESESSVLGGLLLDNNAWDRVGDLLTEGDFYRHEHQLDLHAAIGKLINDSKPADVITVFEHLQGMGKARRGGGIALPEPAGAVRAQRHQHPPLCGNRAREGILRKLLTVSDEIATKALNPQGKPVERILDEAEQKIFAIGEEGSRMKQGFQSHRIPWWSTCSTVYRRWPTTPWM